MKGILYLTSLELTGAGRCLGQVVADGIRHHRALTSLERTTQSSVEAAGVRSLRETLRTNTVLQTLHISQCGLDEADVRAMLVGLSGNSSLSTFSLTGNCLKEAGANVISQALGSNQLHVRKLSLEGDSFGDAGIKALAAGLCANSSLQSLALSLNDVRAAGAKSLAKALGGNSSLQSLDLHANRIAD